MTVNYEPTLLITQPDPEHNVVPDNLPAAAAKVNVNLQDIAAAIAAILANTGGNQPISVAQITDFVIGVAAALHYGTTAGSVCEGNDPRLSNARTPLPHSQAAATITDFQAAVMAALVYGAVGGTVCQGNDVRLANARTPLAHNHGISDIYGTVPENQLPSIVLSIDGLTGAVVLSSQYQLLTERGQPNGYPTLNGAGAVVQNPAGATATPAASKIPIADLDGTLNSWVTASTSFPKAYYYQSGSWSHGGVTDAAARRTIIKPEWVDIDVGGMSLRHHAQVSFDLNADSSWDFGQNVSVWLAAHNYQIGVFVRPTTPNNRVYKLTTAGVSGSSQPTWNTVVGSTTNDGSCVWTCFIDDTIAAGRAGVDYYVYACQQQSGTEQKYVVSRNATVPHGYTANTSRKECTGFHCLCLSVGTISGHTLTGFLTGDILPQSIQDLKHRPDTDVGGFRYDPNTGVWVSIYMLSGTGQSTRSAFGATTQANRNWMDFVDDAQAIRCSLPRDEQFQSFAIGSNEQTNIQGSANPITTGGHVDTNGRRMISNGGDEDLTGVWWQWLLDQSVKWDFGTSWGWYALPGSKGGLYNGAGSAGVGDVKLRAGGSWGAGAVCGSRCRDAGGYRWLADANIGGRAVARSRS